MQATKLTLYTSILLVVGSTGCICPKNLKLAPTYSLSPNGTKTAGGEISLDLAECPGHKFETAWHELQKEKDELNKQFLAGKIPEAFYNKSIQRIDEERKYVLDMLGK